MLSRINEYAKLIQAFLKSGYECFPFIPNPPKENALLLRHDIDFDLVMAKEMAALENSMGVKATYFFLLRSASYNLLEPENTRLVSQIQKYGHQISLHFDPTIYENFVNGLELELNIFEKFFDMKPECISIHRPAEFFLQYDSLIAEIRHTYQSGYTKQITYYSDSQGEFRHGNPLNSEAFRLNRSIHLLIHPIWWVTDNVVPVDILNNFLDAKIKQFQDHVAANCKPYRKVVGGSNFE